MMVNYSRTMRLPAPGLMVVLSGLVMVYGAIALFGMSSLDPMVVKWGLMLLIGFMVVVSFTMHRFWKLEGEKRMIEMRYFKGNIALAAALLMILAMVI